MGLTAIFLFFSESRETFIFASRIVIEVSLCFFPFSFLSFHKNLIFTRIRIGIGDIKVWKK